MTQILNEDGRYRIGFDKSYVWRYNRYLRFESSSRNLQSELGGPLNDGKSRKLYSVIRYNAKRGSCSDEKDAPVTKTSSS